MRRGAILFLSVTVLLCGCGGEVEGRPPVSLSEYAQHVARAGAPYPPETVAAYNAVRARDASLPVQARADSLLLATRVGGDDPRIRRHARVLLADADTPRVLRDAARKSLLGSPERAQPADSSAGPSDQAERAAPRDPLAWLPANRRPRDLAGLVRLWAAEPTATGPDEPRFRHAVEQTTGQPWDRSLLVALAQPGFGAQAEALQILRERLSPSSLPRGIADLSGPSETVAALQAFVRSFDTVPAPRDLSRAVSLYRNWREFLPDAGRLAAAWAEQYAYRFRMPDVPLLAHLANDPLRDDIRRPRLALRLGRAFNERRHVPAAGAGDSNTGEFWLQVDELTMADLWNLLLIDEMLQRPRVQLALWTMAREDRADTRSAWGGLVFYENGQAEAKLYPYRGTAPYDDRTYVPSDRLYQDEWAALLRFRARFERVENADRAGPSPEELQAARDEGQYGLVLTSVSDASFAAHYYSPDGRIVSLGTYPFRR